MRILFIASEMEPLAKVGGLSDVVGTLPKRLNELGCDISVVIPFYRQVRDNLANLEIQPVKLKQDVAVSIDWIVFRGEIWRIELDEIPVYLLRNDELFDRDYIYFTPEGEYPDNETRFGFLSLGALEVAKTLDFKPDILHCHDWQTALVPISLKWRKHLKEDPFFQDSKLVHTIHNIAYQGVFGKEILEKFGLSDFLFNPQGIEFYGKANLLKGAILYSDLVTTVSPTYAEEIKTSKRGNGLEGVLRWISDSSHNLVGILNGIDYDRWNPRTDHALFENYDADSLEMKSKNKSKLRHKVGLRDEEDKPLIGLVSRLVEQKGVELLVESLAQIIDLGFQIVLLGSGEERYERMLKNAEKHHTGNLSVNVRFDSDLSRKIYGASDMFLMPSKFEPCGLGQMIAMRYGSAPVVRGTGGLSDTVRDYTDDRNSGNGFIFHEFSKVSLLDALVRAISVYEKKDEWNELASRIMKEDFSWKISCERYLELYQRLVR